MARHSTGRHALPSSRTEPIVEMPVSETPSQCPQYTLESLPQEILRDIFGYFCPHCSGGRLEPFGPSPLRESQPQYGLSNCARLRLLRGLCLMSRRIRDTAQDVLFHMFSFHQYAPKVQGWHDHRSTFRWENRLTNFIRTVMQRRDLACAVKVISLDPELFRCTGPISHTFVKTISQQAAQAYGSDLRTAWGRRLETDPEWPPEFQSLLKSFLREGPNRGWRSSVKAEVLKDWFKGELLTILIGSLPRLDHVYLGRVWHETGSTFIQASFHPPALRALGAMDLPIRTLEMRSTWVPALFQFTTKLESLSLHGVDTLFRLPLLPALKTLKIKDCRFGQNYLKRIFAACTGELHTFVCIGELADLPPQTTRNKFPESRPRDPEDDTAFWFNYESTDSTDLKSDDIWNEIETNADIVDVVECLKRHRKSLTSLQLQLHPWNRPNRPIPTLREFSALKELCINRCMLSRGESDTRNYPMIVDILPPSIESVFVPDQGITDSGQINMQLRKLVDAIHCEPKRLPRLKRIFLPDWAEESCDTTASLLATVGIHIEYEQWKVDIIDCYARTYIDYLEPRYSYSYP